MRILIEIIMPQSPGADSQGTYFGDTLHTIANERFRNMTLSRNQEFWQYLTVEKQTELEKGSDFTAIGRTRKTLNIQPRPLDPRST